MRHRHSRTAQGEARDTTRRSRDMTGTVIGLCALLAATPLAQAQTLPDGLPVSAQIPQVMLLPFPGRDGAFGPTGWVLIYRNTLSTHDTSATETGTRTIELAGPAGMPQIATITWQIAHTANNRCAAPGHTGCPDTLRILSVPEGFVAVPRSAIVQEHAVQRVFIVPEGMS